MQSKIKDLGTIKSVTKVSGTEVTDTLNCDDYFIPDCYDITFSNGRLWYITQEAIDKFGFRIIMFIGIICEVEFLQKPLILLDRDSWIMNKIFLQGRRKK